MRSMQPNGDVRRRTSALLTAGVVLAAMSCQSWCPAAEPPLGTVIVHPVDGARMVYVPAGPFVMGIDESEANTVAGHLGFKDAETLAAWESYPRHTVELPGYFIDECEVTVARWKKFMAATGHKTTSRETTRHFDHPEAQQFPAGEITWEEATAYARWAKKSLPTEAQWEKAARGTDGRLYPWGDDAPTADLGHFGPQGKASAAADGLRRSAAVGSYPRGRSACGACDMLGNQYEWTAERKRPYPGNPQADRMAGSDEFICLRGGSWYHGWISFFAAKRFGLKPDETYYHVGFRTVWEPPAGYFESADFARDRRAAEGTSTVPPVPLYRAATPPVIDGVLDDACWREAVPVQADLIHAGSGRRTDPAPLIARYAWDDRYLYIGYEVNDADLVSLPSGRESGPEGGRWLLPEEYLPEKGLDLAEFFICFGTDTLMWEVHHDAGNLFNTLRPEIPDPETLAKIPKPSFKDVKFHRDIFVTADGPFTAARAVTLKPRARGGLSTPNDPADKDSGYIGEIRLPWNGLQPPARIARRADGSRALAGETVQLLAVSLDGQGNTASYRSSAAWLPARMFHFSADLWPTFRLVDRPAAAAAGEHGAEGGAKKTPRPPTLKDVAYGEHERQVLDFYRAEAEAPTPLAFLIHGGGWVRGDKAPYPGVEDFLAAGISVVSINYRFTWQAQVAGVQPPVKWPLDDAARALQFVRSKAAQWNIDASRIGASGGSAGGCSSLYLALHDDLAQPHSSDPVARFSTRLRCAAVTGAQTSLDPQQLKEWTPNSRYGGHAFGFMDPRNLQTRDQQFARFLEERERVLPWIKAYSPIELVSADDPPLFLQYPDQPAMGKEQTDPTHTVNYGIDFERVCRSRGVRCELLYPGGPTTSQPSITAFLIHELKRP